MEKLVVKVEETEGGGTEREAEDFHWKNIRGSATGVSVSSYTSIIHCLYYIRKLPLIFLGSFLFLNLVGPGLITLLV